MKTPALDQGRAQEEDDRGTGFIPLDSSPFFLLARCISEGIASMKFGVET